MTSRLRGWLPFYLTSWRLGARGLLQRRALRQAVIRLVVPLDPSRYLEFPETVSELGASAGERVLDLASPKLVAVELGRRGVEVTSLDLDEAEIATWRSLARGERGVTFNVADGRSLPFPDEHFDRAYSISVLEHIPDGGAAEALAELSRVVRPGGRVVITLPYAERYFEDWRDQPLYGSQEAHDGRYFFERWYDEAHLEELMAAVPGLRLAGRRVTRLVPNWHRMYARAFPWLVALGPLYGVLAVEREGPPGDVVRLTFERSGTP
jgi:SAM-dependent methyltransferase